MGFVTDSNQIMYSPHTPCGLCQEKLVPPPALGPSWSSSGISCERGFLLLPGPSIVTTTQGCGWSLCLFLSAHLVGRLPIGSPPRRHPGQGNHQAPDMSGRTSPGGGGISENEDTSGSALLFQKDTCQGPFLTLPARMVMSPLPWKCNLVAKPPSSRNPRLGMRPGLTRVCSAKTDDPHPTCGRGQPEICVSQTAFVLLPLAPGPHRGLLHSPGERRLPALCLSPAGSALACPCPAAGKVAREAKRGLWCPPPGGFAPDGHTRATQIRARS